MAGNRPYPRCTTCGERIGVYEPIWLHHPDGTLATTALLKLDDELRSSPDGVRFFHLGCLAPDQPRHTRTG